MKYGPLILPCLLAVAALTLPARAQLQLPGAMKAPTPAGATTPPPGGGKPRAEGEPAAPAAIMVRAPGDRTLEGRTLALNGRTGVLRFTRNAGKLELSEMKLTGDRLSKVGDSCTMTIPGGPFAVEQDGRIEGLLQLRVDVPACPFTLAVLDGAVMVTHKGSRVSTGLGAGTCEIKAEDCRGYLAGFWGPPGGGIGPADSKNIEAARSEAEKNARNNFRALIRRVGNDREKTRTIAADQAGFSARREEVCRDYLREHQHGFCASRFTQARAVSLAAQIGNVEVDDGTAKPAPKPRPRRPPTPRPDGAPASPGMASPAPLQPVFR